MTGTRPLGWAAALATIPAAGAVGLWVSPRPPPAASVTSVGSGGDPGAFIAATLMDAPEPVVTSLQSYGSGEQAGLRVGDHIIAVGGRPSPSLGALAADLRRLPPGPVDIRVRRGEKIGRVLVLSTGGGRNGG